MPNIRHMPKWLAFLIPISLALAMLCAPGCSSDDNDPSPQRPDYSHESGIANIALSRGTLEPAFSETVRNYGATFYSGASNLSLTVTLKESKARLTINDEDARSGIPFSVSLAEGFNTINIGVAAEDGKNSNIVSITANVIAPNTSLYVLDGIGGAPVEGAMITLTDANHKTLEANIPLSADNQGTPLLGLDPRQKYHIYAKGANSAEACFAWFDPSRETTAALYCLPGWAAPFVSKAPVIERISFADNIYANAAWKDLPPGENKITSTHIEIPFVRITAISRNPIIYESGAGSAGPAAFPIQVALDGKAWEDSRFMTWLNIEDAAPVMIGGVQYFRTTYSLPMPYTYILDGNITFTPLSSPNHWLDIVVYDQANNRTEQRLYLTLTDAIPSTVSDTDISAMAPRLFTAQGQTYGVSMNISGINPIDTQGVKPVDGYGVTSYNYLEFNLTGETTTNSSATSLFPAIRGFEVYRSTDNLNFSKIDAIHYAVPTRGITVSYPYYWRYYQMFTYTDISPELQENITYYYKIRAFNGNPAGGGYSPMGNALSNKLLPAFVTQLAEPAHNSVSNKLWPTFRFRLTNPALLNANVSDYFFFSLCLKDTQDLRPIFILPVMVDFTRPDQDGNPWIGYRTRPYWDYFENADPYSEAVYYDEEGNPVPFVYITDDGAIAIEADNYVFQYAVYQNYSSFYGLSEYELTPGKTYEWTIFGRHGGIPGYLYVSDSLTHGCAYFYKEWPAATSAPGGATSQAFSFGSSYDYGLGSPNGFFILTIDPDAK